MRILFWNIGYAPGLDGSLKHYGLKGHRLVRLPQELQKQVLDEVAAVVTKEQLDLALYAEVSLGSGRNQRFNQHEYLMSQIPGVVCGGAALKYRRRMIERLPLHSGNANGFLSWHPCEVNEVHFSVGKKTLVYVIQMGELSVVMVHLSLQKKRRAAQLNELAYLVNAIKGPVVVCGDMNIFGGIDELTELIKLTGLMLPPQVPFTYPAFRPKLALDLFLLRDCGGAEVRSLASVVSDHAPILIDLPELSIERG